MRLTESRHDDNRRRHSELLRATDQLVTRHTGQRKIDDHDAVSRPALLEPPQAFERIGDELDFVAVASSDTLDDPADCAVVFDHEHVLDALVILLR